MSDADDANTDCNAIDNLGDGQSGDDFIEFNQDEQEDNVYISVPNYQMPLNIPARPLFERPRRQLADHPLAAMTAAQHDSSAPKAEFQPEKICRSKFKINVRGDDWTTTERESLIGALKKFGLLDMPSICKEVPSKTELQIREFIRVAWKSSRKELNVENKKLPDEYTLLETPITQWLNALEDTSKNKGDRFGAYNKMLPKAFLFISKYDNHPEAASCGGINFRDAYEYIYYMLSGLPGKALSPETARFVRKTLYSLSYRARNGSQAQSEFIRDVSASSLGVEPASKRRCYTAKEATHQKKSQVPEERENSAEKEVILKLMKLPGANPLNVPIEILELSSVPKKSNFPEPL